MIRDYKHSVSLDIEKCRGCTACLKRCPTEAIRIRDGHAVINPVRCIDCGECIRVCPYKAKKATHDALSVLDEYKYTVALPAPSLYGQFDNLDNIGYIIRGLLDLGFDDVFEVACAAELVSAYTRKYLTREDIKRPIISSACPTITRLISTNYPYLCENIMPILPPIDIAAMLAREKAKEEHPELSDDDIGVIFISPCPAKVSYVKNNFAGERNYVSATVSVRDIYFALLDKMNKYREEPYEVTEAGIVGIGWASTGGESTAILNDRYLAADGIENCIRVLDQIDSADITNLDFVELNACSGGCVGGAMTVANPYIAQARLQSLKRYLPVSPNRPASDWIPDKYFHEKEVEYNPYSLLSSDRKTAMRMMSDIEAIAKALPGLDCGSCGAPNCTAFAEDVVKCESRADECTVILKKIMRERGIDMERGEILSHFDAILQKNHTCEEDKK
ncbi:MAG: 4Fe-4S dicluster domain-containing protein [Ruminococcaceae bacterium]|nr:4Fe-4S dicluster domain-containing protein [Oscillospiraceae bacterium]